MCIKALVKLNGISLNFLMYRRCKTRRKHFPFLYSLYINDLANFLLQNHVFGLQRIIYEINIESELTTAFETSFILRR